MTALTLQLHDSILGWLDAGQLVFFSKNDLSIEYDLDFSCSHLGNRADYALSVQAPVTLEIPLYRGPVPGFLVDLVPQGPVLRQLRARYGIRNDDDYEEILSTVPLASPGNLRVKEAWLQVEERRPSYQHPGFTRQELVAAGSDFLRYMEDHDAPIAGTSGAAGGAPKFLMREDKHGRLHADGYLDDKDTKQAYLVKFPFTSSANAKLLVRVEKSYYDLLRTLPFKTGGAIEILNDVLFIPRFDRIRHSDGRLHYYGLESFYSAHGLNTHGQSLRHEDNLRLLKRFSADWQADVCEYLCRDLLYQALGNTDNHGRNTSLLKADGVISLSPIYDVTAMRLFKDEMIIPLTRWELAPTSIVARLKWLSDDLGIDVEILSQPIVELRDSVIARLEEILAVHSVPSSIIADTKEDRESVLQQLSPL